MCVSNSTEHLSTDCAVNVEKYLDCSPDVRRAQSEVNVKSLNRSNSFKVTP